MYYGNYFLNIPTLIQLTNPLDNSRRNFLENELLSMCTENNKTGGAYET
jgi:hypothetical protein